MPLEKTVILGEASEEESDTEEITLRDNKKLTRPTNTSEFQGNQDGPTDERQTDRKTKPTGSGLFGSSILSSITSTSTLTKLVNNYSPYGLLTSAGPQTPPTTGLHKASLGTSNMTTSLQSSDINQYNQLPILHRALYTRNQQLYACLNHLYKHPLQKASKDVHTISQRLVTAQRNLQEVDVAVMKIKREQKNLDININMIA